MGFPGAHNVRRRPQGLGVARDVTPRIGVLRRRGGTERSAITTGVASLAASQNGTSDVLAERKHARRLAGLATPQTGVRGQGRKIRA